MGNGNAVILPKLNQPRNSLVSLHIAVLGETFVGKTCLARTYETGVFEENTCLRIGASRHIRRLKVQNIVTELFIWNVVGQERYREIIPSYIRPADGVLVLYDVANVLTFHKISNWLEAVRKLKPEAIIFIIGARSDLLDRKEVTRETAQKFARDENLEFFECSAKTGENVEVVFELMALKILQKKGLIPPDKIEIIEGKSLESRETKEKLSTIVTDEGKLCASITETIKIQNSSAEEDTQLQSEEEVCNASGKNNSNMSSQSNNKKTSDLSEGCYSSDNKETDQPKKAVISEDMLLEGKCPSWFA